MAPDFPSDLIRDIQISLRHAAGIPSYDPADPALPTVPSIEEAVVALDPSLPDYLRCKRCHGGLCRGINSTLCIFCGAEQSAEGISRTISFHSTAGYRRFLQSLNLDGSEIVNFEAESKDSTKGQDSPKSGVTLSNLLDYELIWPSHVKESKNYCSSKALSQVALASLSGINLDKFFPDQKTNEVSSRSSDSHTTSNSPPPLSAHGDHLPSVQLDTVLSGTSNDASPQANLSSSFKKFSFLDGQHSLDAGNNSPDAKGGDSDDAFADWETDFQSASSVIFEAKSKPIDSFQNYADIQSTNSTAIHVEPLQIDPFQNSSSFRYNSPTDLFHNSAGFQSTIFETDAMESSFVDLSLELSSQSTDSGMVLTDFGPTNHLKNYGIEKSDRSIKILKEADKLESISSTSVGEVKNEGAPVRVNWSQDDSWRRSSVNEINNRKALDHHDDDVDDDWQDFTTSINPLENFSEAKLEDLGDLDFGNFIQSDSVSAAFNDAQSSSDVNRIEACYSNANSMNQSNEKPGNSSIHRDLDVGNAIAVASQHEVDMLLAQMPDLSFMLEDSLCIPKKPSSSELNT